MIPVAKLEQGLRIYWEEIGTRGSAELQRELRFQYLAVRFAWRTPPRFVRADFEEIILWKYTDARRRDAAVRGLSDVSDVTLEQASSVIALLDDPAAASSTFRGLIKGIGIAGSSAILAAARPDLFPVIDMFALAAIEEHCQASWLDQLAQDEAGRPQADFICYPDFTFFCRETAQRAAAESRASWTPREVDMALWALGR